MNTRRIILTIFCVCIPQVTLGLNYVGKDEVRFDKYTVYYNTFPSVALEPRIANAVGINRSDSRNVLTIVVKKQGSDQSVKASISGSVVTLMGHVRTIKLREVRDGEVVYYVGDFTALDRENLTFNVSVHPEGEINAVDFKFKRGIFSR